MIKSVQWCYVTVVIIINIIMVADRPIHFTGTWKKFVSASYSSIVPAVEVLKVQLGGPCTFGPAGNK